MTSYLTDEEREKRYMVLRRKKKFADAVRGIAMTVTAFCGLLCLASAFTNGILKGIVSQTLIPFLIFLLTLALIIFFIFVIYRKSFSLTLIALCISGICLFADLVPIYVPVMMGASLFCDAVERFLMEEEGYPHFSISYEELKERKLNYTKRAEYRALQAKTRVLEENRESSRQDMTDVLEADSTIAPLPQHLTSYHERSSMAQPVEQAAPNKSHSMDEL
ncbi:MAG: hypothetical protein MJ071_05365 [Oscillospiraceae bacterium]|nr:hypothetical protein [Oscillospiraceae bacterium]